MRERPLATLVTLASDGIQANHIPLYLDADAGRFGTLQGHVARANPLWHDLVEGVETLAIFHGPDAYVSPSWYPARHSHGKVVPTWNYIVVHAYGTLRVVDDPVWIRAHLEALTAEHEEPLKESWSISDAPEEFIERLVGSVVGIEISITRLSGKWKVSQNQPAENQWGVIDALGKGVTAVR